MAIICPITSNIKDFPTHYILEDTNIVSGEVIHTIVNNLYYYDSFSELYKDHDKVSLGYREDEDANCQDMERYYSLEEQAKYGGVGFKIRLLKK